jgi:hypothetical protein
MMRYQPVSCLNIVNLLIALALWAIILWVGSCAYDNLTAQEFYSPRDSTLTEWNSLFSKDGTFLIIADTCFTRGDSMYWWVDFYVSTGDPDNVMLWREEWSRALEGYGLPKGKGNNPLRL